MIMYSISEFGEISLVGFAKLFLLGLYNQVRRLIHIDEPLYLYQRNHVIDWVGFLSVWGKGLYNQSCLMLIIYLTS